MPGLPRDPAALAALVKSVPLVVRGVRPLERAISSAGGICRDQVSDDFELRILPGLFVAGEMLDWEAPTGGYLLQATFATAESAARGMATRLGVNLPKLPAAAW
jgi:predicted flavoprotein YhiN